MKLIIDIPDYNIKDIQNGSIACSQVLKAVKNGKPYEERPQGEWVRTGSMTKRSYQRMCDNCHNIVYFCGKGNYPNCPYCLADMKGGAE